MVAPTSRNCQHRARAKTVPRAAVVNAGRPGLRPGRSAAKSIDDGEHGTRLTDAMLERLDTRAELGRALRAKSSRVWTDTRANFWSRFSRRLPHRTRHAGGALFPRKQRAPAATLGSTSDGVNDPASDRARATLGPRHRGRSRHRWCLRHRNQSALAAGTERRPLNNRLAATCCVIDASAVRGVTASPGKRGIRRGRARRWGDNRTPSALVPPHFYPVIADDGGELQYCRGRSWNSMRPSPRS
jgi:hypothetical protein